MRSRPKRRVLAALPSVYLAAIFLLLCLSVCFFRSLAAGQHLSIHCPAPRLPFFSLFSLCRKHINMPTASMGTTLTNQQRLYIL